MFERELRELSFVQRFGIARKLNPQSVAEHSYYVITYALQLADLFVLGKVKMAEVAMYAAAHDISEAATGDIPAPFKSETMRRHPGAISDIEDEYMITRFPSIQHWFDADDDVKQIVRVADALDALFWCCTEEQMGNRTLGCGLQGQDLVDARKSPDKIGTMGIAQHILVALSKAWFGLKMMDEKQLMAMWRGIVEPSIIRHLHHQSRILIYAKDDLRMPPDLSF